MGLGECALVPVRGSTHPPGATRAKAARTGAAAHGGGSSCSVSIGRVAVSCAACVVGLWGVGGGLLQGVRASRSGSRCTLASAEMQRTGDAAAEARAVQAGWIGSWAVRLGAEGAVGCRQLVDAGGRPAVGHSLSTARRPLPRSRVRSHAYTAQTGQ